MARPGSGTIGFLPILIGLVVVCVLFVHFNFWVYIGKARGSIPVDATFVGADVTLFNNTASDQAALAIIEQFNELTKSARGYCYKLQLLRLVSATARFQWSPVHFESTPDSIEVVLDALPVGFSELEYPYMRIGGTVAWSRAESKSIVTRVTRDLDDAAPSDCVKEAIPPELRHACACTNTKVTRRDNAEAEIQQQQQQQQEKPKGGAASSSSSEIVAGEMTDDGMTPLVAKVAQSCENACSSAGLKCSKLPEHVKVINVCKFLKKTFKCRDCVYETGPDQPAFHPPAWNNQNHRHREMCLVNQAVTTSPEYYNCAASHELTQRLCACVTN